MDTMNSQKEEADKLIEQLKQEVKDRDDEIAMVKEEEANQQQEKQLLLDEVQQLSEAVENLKDKDLNIARLQGELEALTQEKVNLEHRLVSVEDELVQLKEKNLELQVETERLNATLTVAESRGEAAGTFLETPPDVPAGTLSSSTPAIVDHIPLLVEEEAISKVEESVPLHLAPSTVPCSQDPDANEELERVRTEMSEIHAELSKVKAVNDKLKAKLRAQIKKEKVKSESVSEHDSRELMADIEKVRQEKLNLEKAAYEMREELDEIVRHKDGVIGDLKVKAQKLLDEKARNESLVEKYEKLLSQRDDEIQDLKNRFQILCKDKDDSIEQLGKTLEREKLDYVQELETCKDGYEQVLGNKETELENVQRDLANAKMEIDQLTNQLHEAQQSLQELNKLKVDFDHIVSGLREDLQQALDEKAAADQIAHEFRVQLKRNENSVEQSGVQLEELAVGTTEADKTAVDVQLKATQEEVEFLKKTVKSANKEKEELQESLEMLKHEGKGDDTGKADVEQAGVDVKDGGGDKVVELTGMPDDVLWLQSELKKASELNETLSSKLKAALRKKRTKSDSREEEASSETRAELERSRAAKLESDRKVQELREELDNFVREKEMIVTALKSKIQQVSQENEAAMGVVEEYEKQLLDNDSNVRDLTEQIQSLSSKNTELKEALEELTAMNSQLQSVAQDADDAKTALEALEKTNQSLINERTQEYSELQHQLENTKEEYERVIQGLKEVLTEKEREVDESNAELRKDNTELQKNIEMLAEQKDVMETELLKTRSELEQVRQDSYPVIEEKDRKISDLEILMEEKQRKTDESILELQSNERTLQDRIQVLDARNSEIKNQLQEVQKELGKRLQEEEGLEAELARANSQIDELNAQIHVATQEKQDINKLQNNFDHIMSGLREDLQQALDGKAAADELAHEFQVQLEDFKKSTQGAFSMGADSNRLLEENKVTEMLEAAQREMIDLKSALEVVLKERDDLQDKIKDFELSLEEKSNKQPISSLEVDLKYAERGDVGKVVEEVILQSSVDNQNTAAPASETEVELENMKNEMQRIKALNDRLKAKLRTVVKKKRVKSNSGDEDSSVRDELQAELEQVRQGKLDSEKACQQLRVELDAFVRQKESIVSELKSKIEQLVIEKENSNSLVERCEQQIVQKDNELQEMRDNVRDLQNQNDEAWKIVQELREENTNLHVQEQELDLQRTEIERECRRLKQEMEGLADDVFKRESTISNLQNQLEDLADNYKTELDATAIQHKGVIFEIQSHADQLERELLSANKEVEQLKSQLQELKKDKEDIAKLKMNFDHIIGGLREDLQHALEGKAAADQIAHEFQVQLKRLEKVSDKVETKFSDVAVDTSDLEGKEDVLEKLQATQNEVDNLRDALESLNREKINLEERNRLFEEREEQSSKIRRDEQEGDREKIVSEVLIQSPENEEIQAAVYDNEALLESPPVQSMFSDGENIQKVKDDLSIAQSELEKVKSVNERLKAKLRTLMRKTKDAKSGAGQEGSKEEIVAELNKVRQEKLESEKAVQELRVELDAFVREKERILNELKEQIHTLLAEKEESSSLVEQFEKVLLERDVEISSLGEQLQALDERRNEVNQKLVENREENQNLRALLEQLQLQKVKAERELQQEKLQTEQLVQGQQPLLDSKDQQIAQLHMELSNQRELFTEEMGRFKDSYESVISEQQNHVNNLEAALVSAHTEVEHLKSRVHTLEQGKEDIDKLRTDFDHIVSGLSEDLQRALQGKATADEIAHEFQVKLKRFDQSSTSSEVECKDVCVGTEEMESLSLLGKDRDIEKLQEILHHLTDEKEELEERVMALDEVVQDREGKCQCLQGSGLMSLGIWRCQQQGLES